MHFRLKLNKSNFDSVFLVLVAMTVATLGQKKPQPSLEKVREKTCRHTGEKFILISGIMEVRDYIQQEITPAFQVRVIAMGSQ